MTALREVAARYLEVRRALGYKLERTERLLNQFLDFMESEGADVVTVDLALGWATLPVDGAERWWAYRLGVVRGFARHLANFDPRTEVPPNDLLAERSHRAVPHLYSDDEVRALMAAARALRSPLRAATFSTLIGLLRATGLRVGEAMGLDRTDVDLDEGVVLVRRAKFDKTRLVPLHETTRHALFGYAAERDQLCRHELGPSFFITRSGTRLQYCIVYLEFSRLLQRAGIEARPPSGRPRLHDLRHTFAVSTLVACYQEGIDPESRLAILSTYLGHVHPRTTYWYLSGSPELLSLALTRLETPLGWMR